MDAAIGIEAVQGPGSRGFVVCHRSAVEAALRIAAPVVHADQRVGEDRWQHRLLSQIGPEQRELVLGSEHVAAAASSPDGRGNCSELVSSGAAVGVDLHDGTGQHVDQQQPVVVRVPEWALAVESAGVGELLRTCVHIQPPSTIHRWAVQARESSAASQSSSRATSSGYTLSGRHWFRTIDSSASGVTQWLSCFSVMLHPGMMQFTRMYHGPYSRARVRVSPSTPALAVM